jgi:hypothetical protein
LLDKANVHKDAVAAFDRRCFSCRAAQRDVLFPDSMFEDSFLSEDLRKLGLSEDHVHRIQSSVRLSAENALKALDHAKQLSTLIFPKPTDFLPHVSIESVSADLTSVHLHVQAMKKKIDQYVDGHAESRAAWSHVRASTPLLSCKTPVTLTLSPVVFHRLQSSHRVHAVDLDTSGDTNSLFALHLWCMLHRYDTLASPGNQGAIPDAVFDLFKSQLGTTFECFASPLNRSLDRFGSAFQDTDSVFGSSGSFFDMTAIPADCNGSFEANPPFDLGCMADMLGTMNRLLALKRPVSFAVVVPAYEKSAPHWIGLSSHEMLRFTCILPANEHHYKEGFHYRLRKQYRMAAFETGVFIVQNAMAAKQWPVRPTFEKELKTAFLSAQRSSASGVSFPHSRAQGHDFASRKRMHPSEEDTTNANVTHDGQKAPSSAQPESRPHVRKQQKR